MSWSSGVFTRARGSTEWQTDAAGGVGITASLHDDQDNDLATGINTCLTKDGQNAATANLPMGGFRHTNVGNATARTHYASAGQVQDSSIQWIGLAGGTANALTGSLTPAPTALTDGMTFRFKANASNTSTVTFNLNSLGAVTVYRIDGTNLAAGDILSGSTYEITVANSGAAFILSSFIPTWIAVTPVVTQGVSITVTNNYSKYIQIGKDVRYEFNLAITSSGSGSVLISVNIPVTAGSSGAFRVVGSGQFYDASSNTNYVIIPYLTSTSVVAFTSDTSAGNNFGAAPAITVANGDIISGAIFYESA